MLSLTNQHHHKNQTCLFIDTLWQGQKTFSGIVQCVTCDTNSEQSEAFYRSGKKERACISHKMSSGTVRADLNNTQHY